MLCVGGAAGREPAPGGAAGRAAQLAPGEQRRRAQRRHRLTAPAAASASTVLQPVT